MALHLRRVPGGGQLCEDDGGGPLAACTIPPSRLPWRLVVCLHPGGHGGLRQAGGLPPCPLLAEKIGFDPAVMASPFITTIVDALSLLIYFRFATWILGV